MTVQVLTPLFLCFSLCACLISQGSSTSQDSPTSSSSTEGGTTATSAPSGEPTTSSSISGACSDDLWMPFPDEESIAAECESRTEMNVCLDTKPKGASRCEWISTLHFPECDGIFCSDAQLEQICVAVWSTETGCFGGPEGLWRRNSAGLYVIHEKYCFELPVGWSLCQVVDRPECNCSSP